MRLISRREAVGTLVALPSARLLKSLGIKPTMLGNTEVPTTVTTLNVVFHGLFAFVLWNNSKYIQAIAPIVSNHSYLVGGQALASLQPLGQGQRYTLNGVTAGNMSTGFDPSKNSVFGNIHQIDFRQSHCEILLPFPDTVSLLRVVPMQSGCDFYKTAPTLTQKPTSLPLIHVFSYTLGTTSKPTLNPLTALNMDTTASFYNLHLRAEPKVDMAGGPVGFASLDLLFPELQAQLNSCYDSYYASPDTSFPPGLSAMDECTLEELISNQCPPPPTMDTLDSKSAKSAKHYPFDGKLVNCHSVVILE